VAASAAVPPAMQQAATAPAIIIDRKVRRFMAGMLLAGILARKARGSHGERADNDKRGQSAP
jgi:hypothetical protein